MFVISSRAITALASATAITGAIVACSAPADTNPDAVVDGTRGGKQGGEQEGGEVERTEQGLGDAGRRDAARDAAEDTRTGDRGASCSGPDDCDDRKCSPITKTCGACFLDGNDCAKSTDCCNSPCNADGKCGIKRAAIGKACDHGDGVFCNSDAYCNGAGACEKGCRVSADCVAGDTCFQGFAMGQQGETTGFCVRSCAGFGKDSACAASVHGKKCDPYDMNVNAPHCGCKFTEDCPAGYGCYAGGCKLKPK